MEEQKWEEEEQRDEKLKFGNFEANNAGESAGPGEVPQETSGMEMVLKAGTQRSKS